MHILLPCPIVSSPFTINVPFISQIALEYLMSRDPNSELPYLINPVFTGQSNMIFPFVFNNLVCLCIKIGSFIANFIGQYLIFIYNVFKILISRNKINIFFHVTSILN